MGIIIDIELNCRKTMEQGQEEMCWDTVEQSEIYLK